MESNYFIEMLKSMNLRISLSSQIQKSSYKTISGSFESFIYSTLGYIDVTKKVL